MRWEHVEKEYRLACRPVSGLWAESYMLERQAPASYAVKGVALIGALNQGSRVEGYLGKDINSYAGM
jgi:hypothetical protein